jgi:Ca2+-binding EF-hand superfamily protein
MIKLIPAALFLSAAVPAIAQNLPDRSIRRDEVIAAVTKQFAGIDANHDGVVTREEFDRFRASQAGRSAAASTDPFSHVGAHWFEHADASGTGRVTLSAAEQHPLQLFDMADVNRDGSVSLAEMRAAEAMRSLMGH